MLNKLVGFVKTIKQSVSKYDVQTELEQALSQLDSSISDYEAVLDADPYTQFTTPQSKQLIKEFYHELYASKPNGVILTPTKDFLRDMIILLKNARENGELVKLRLANYKSEVIVPSAIPIDAAVILRAVPHYTYMSQYSVELLNYMITCETSELAKTVDTTIPIIKVNKVKNNIQVYAALLAGYGRNTKDFKRVITDLPELVIDTSQEEQLNAYLDGLVGDVVPAIPVGFAGSPIYTIRMIIATWQAKRYHIMIDQKKLYELRLNYYNSLKNSGTNAIDARTEKEIAILQNRVNKLSLEIAKMEEN